MANEARQYLISFLATLKGDKAVLTGLQKMEREINKTRKTMGKTAKTTKDFGSVMGNLAKRALVTIPVWLLLRSVFMGIIRTIGDVIRSNIQFEEQLARIRTVMQGTSSEIDRDMAVIKSVILDTAINSRLGIEELAEGFYFLKTANLDANQALEAFSPAVALAVGTGNSLKETTRAVAGVFNTMGKAMTDLTTDAEKFEHISDTLAYTYATQDVQLSELIASYEKLAPYTSGLSDSFLDLTTTLGFLNTRLLRSGRTGRLTGRAILQLTKNAENLASILGITFDENKPINFLGVMKQIHSALNTGTKLSAKQSQAIQDVFATRGAVPIRLLLESFEEWNESLELAGINAEGFAEKMQEIRMNTVSAQASRLKSILAVLGNDFITGATSGNSFAETLKIINEVLINSRGVIRFLGDAIGFYFTKLSESVLMMETIGKKLPELLTYLNPMNLLNPEKMTQAFGTIRDIVNELKAQDLTTTWKEYREENEKARKELETQNKEKEKYLKAEKELIPLSTIRTDKLKTQKENLKSQVKIMKILGAHEKDIARYKLDQLDILAENMTQEDEQIERLKLQNELLEAQTKYRQEIISNVRTTALDLLKTMGASESQILEIKIRQLQLDKEQMGQAEFMLQLTRLRQQQQVSLLQEKQKELQTATSLYQKYKQADEFERTRLRRLMELRQLSPEELAKKYKEDMFDQRVIDEYFSHFSQQGQQAIGEIIRQMFNLPTPAQGGLAELPVDQLRNLLKTPDLTTPFWDNWMIEARERLNEFKQEWERVFTTAGGIGTVGKTIQDRIAIDQNVDLGTKIDNVEINLPDNALENVAEEAGNQLKEALLNNEEFQKKFVERIRRLI